jgi:hypothetical protein
MWTTANRPKYNRDKLHIPKDLPPKSTMFHYCDLWNYNGTLRMFRIVTAAFCCSRPCSACSRSCKNLFADAAYGGPLG